MISKGLTRSRADKLSVVSGLARPGPTLGQAEGKASPAT